MAYSKSRDPGSQVFGQKQTTEQLEYLSNFDSFTDLPNRMLFYDRMDQTLTKAKREKHMVSLLNLNIDGLKSISGTHRRKEKKLFLKEIANRLRFSVRKSDTVARIGRDTFTIALSKITKSVDAAIVSKKIIASLTKPISVNGSRLSLKVNIGISLFPSDGNHTETLLKSADTAMSHAKEKGTNNYRYYTSHLNDTAVDRMTLEKSLRRAVDLKEFVIHYELQIDLKSGRISGLEALVRWKHPDVGLVFPREFIHFAKETGLIAKIDEWVLYTACAQNKAWQKAGFPPMRIAINMSDFHFKNQNIINTIKQVFKKTGMEPCYLELELTERTIMSNERRILYLLRELTNMGIRISIDDFGTGYSSLTNLRDFPISKLKIDRSFIRSLATDSEKKAIVKAIISIARSFDFKVIAEGVETVKQLKYLRDIKCDEAQGYLFSKHLPQEAITQLLKKAQSNNGMGITGILGIKEE